MLKGTYFPDHNENRMTNEGDLEQAREILIQERPNNLNYLLSKRYSWMNNYISGLDTVIELGCGAGFSKLYLDCPGLILTDVTVYSWVDKFMDALNPSFEDESVDAFICSHMIHHLANPIAFFNGLKIKLQVGGLIIIQDIYTSLLMRSMLRLMRHEGWSYDLDIFDASRPANNPEDPWSANCAIPELLFWGDKPFESMCSGYKIEKRELNECILFPLSGGVIAKTKTINLPYSILRFIDKFDRLLVTLSPKLFALGCSVVLRRIS